MRIKILSSAIDDLRAGQHFYERQGEGLGVNDFTGINFKWGHEKSAL